jgi:Domain of unknown function (DUF4390)
MLGYESRSRCVPPVYLHRNHSSPNTAVPGLGRLAFSLAFGLWMLASFAANGQALTADLPPPAPVADDPGRFEVRSASVELDDGVYLLNARIEYRLSSEAREALQAGVPLNIRLDVEILHTRRFWFDNTDAELRQRFQLDYHALSERYIVLNVNSGEQASFGSLFGALSYLGRVDKLPLIDAALLEERRDHRIRLRAVLDVERFPGPLRLLAFWRRDWSLSSGWYQWPLPND